MLKRDKMFAPEIVERLQHDLLFDIAHDVRRVFLDSRRIGLVRHSIEVFAHAFVVNALFFGPSGDFGSLFVIKIQHVAHVSLQAGNIPRLGIGIVRNMFGHKVVNQSGPHVTDGFFQTVVGHHVAALLKHHFALHIHHVIIFDNILAHVEIARFDLLLRLLNRFVDHIRDQSLVLFHPDALHQGRHALATENAHQVIFHRQEEFRPARISLPSRATAQLVVDTAAFMPLGADNIQATGLARLILEARHFGADFSFAGSAGFPFKPGTFMRHPHFDIAAKLDVGATPGHVGCHRNRAGNASFGDDESFLLVETGIQNGKHFGGLAIAGPLIEFGKRVGSGKIDLSIALFYQKRCKFLGFLNGCGADQHRLQTRIGNLDLANDGAQLFLIGTIDLISLVFPAHLCISRNFDNIQVINLAKFVSLGRGCAGHTRELAVEPEIILEGDGRHGDVFGLHSDVLLGFQRLMQTFRIAASRHHAAGKLVNDHHFVVADDIILVALKQRVSAQRLIDMMHQRHIMRLIKRPVGERARLAQQVFNMLIADFGQMDRSLLFINLVVLLRH